MKTTQFADRMKIYWSYRSIPEMEGLSKEQRKAAWRFAFGKTFWHWPLYFGLALCGLLPATGSYIFGMPGAAIGGALGGAVFGQITGVIARPYIAAYKELISKRTVFPDILNKPD